MSMDADNLPDIDVPGRESEVRTFTHAYRVGLVLATEGEEDKLFLFDPDESDRIAGQMIRRARRIRKLLRNTAKETDT